MGTFKLYCLNPFIFVSSPKYIMFEKKEKLIKFFLGISYQGNLIVKFIMFIQKLIKEDIFMLLFRIRLIY